MYLYIYICIYIYVYYIILYNCSVSHGENDKNICELQHVWNVCPALLWIAASHFLLSWSPPAQTSGIAQEGREKITRTRWDHHKVQVWILIFAGSTCLILTSTFFMGKSPFLRLIPFLVLKPLWLLWSNHAESPSFQAEIPVFDGDSRHLKPPPERLGSLAERTGWGDDVTDGTAGMVRLPPWLRSCEVNFNTGGFQHPWHLNGRIILFYMGHQWHIEIHGSE